MPHSSASPAPGRAPHLRPAIDADAAFRARHVTTPSSAGGAIRCACRIALVLMWALWASFIQAILLKLPFRWKVSFARFFWRKVCVIFGIRLRVIGNSAGQPNNASDIRRGVRPVIYVANHSSWLDIPALGGTLPAVFVSKSAVDAWPVIGTIARLGRTIFVSRNRQETTRELNDMAGRLHQGDNFVLFPEGTSSDGSRVLPFLASFFAIAKPGRLEQAGVAPAPPVLIQPVSIVYDGLEGLPVPRSRRNTFSWYGDMDLAPHVWSFGRWRSMRATIILHPPLDPGDFRSRKDLANATFDIVSRGSEDLRQGRDIVPGAIDRTAANS